MRIAVISDIHANLVALESVLSDLESDHVDHIVCLGDIATDGPQPRQVLAQLKALGSSMVMGNMDSWLLDPPPENENPNRLTEIEFWDVSQLSAGDLEYLRTFQATVEFPLDDTGGILCYHGSPKSSKPGISSTTPDEDLERVLSGCRATVLAGGHTHSQMVRRYRGYTILNPGSVGDPLPQTDPDCRPARAEYGLICWENTSLRIELRCVPVDLDLVTQAVRRSGMPHADWWLTNRYGTS